MPLSRHPRVLALLPFLFVLLWSTGFLGARLGLPHIEPLTFLLLRYLCVLLMMSALAGLMRSPWPQGARAWFHIGMSGLLMHGVYLGGVFIAIRHGLPAGVTSLIVGLQPLLTALIAGAWLGEDVSRRQWAGLGLGFIGVAGVVFGRTGGGFSAVALVPAITALLGITLGTLYQKRYAPKFDWRGGAVVQFLPTTVLTGLAAWHFETMRVDWAPGLVFALAWLVLVLSLGAVSLLNWLIRQSDAVNVASLFYLVPPCTALLAWLLFDEHLAGLALAGMGLAVWGVWLARR